MYKSFLDKLREANKARQEEWDPSNLVTWSYRANEMQSEAGEAGNVVKKLEREQLGIVSKRDTVEHLQEELADVMICIDLLAMAFGIDLETAVIAKFNATSIANNLQTRLT